MTTRVGVLPHAAKPDARDLGGKLVGWLSSRGHAVSLLPEDAQAFGCPEHGAPRESFSDLDLLVVLGGDGTMLHGIELAGLAGVPILGVNLGRVGFLTEVGPDDVFGAMQRTLDGDFSLDERSTVAASIVRASGETVAAGEGINEVSIERNVGGKVIRMTLTLSGQQFVSVAADGLIVSTPTGSTAYAFSMRGPIVAPELRALVVVAVGAHSLFDRPLVVAAEDVIEVGIARGSAMVVVDGRPRVPIGEGDRLMASGGPSTVRLVRFGPDTYFTRVSRKFGLPSD